MKKGKRRTAESLRAGFLGAGDETPTVFAFSKPIGVLRVDPEKDLRRFMFVGNSSKRSDPLDDPIQGHVRIEF